MVGASHLERGLPAGSRDPQSRSEGLQTSEELILPSCPEGLAQDVNDRRRDMLISGLAIRESERE